MGRRRAPEPRVEQHDPPASHALMAAVWGGVTRLHEIIGRRLLHFENTASDSRLSEQLSLLAALHDLRPVTESEAADLLYLAELYLAPTADATEEDVARALGATVRAMAVRRAAIGVVPQP
ncbi:MAG TPA: hypothetical protein VF416_07670 [Marmoricola sp.]